MGQFTHDEDHWSGMVHVRRIVVLIALAVGFSFVCFALIPRRSPQEIPITWLNVSPDDQDPLHSLPAPEPGSSLGAPPLYPYSIIPGGVRSSQELKIAVANDPVVAAHYQGFDLSKSRILRLDRDRMVYISYRLGGRVFWTKKKLKLVKGEMLVSDGAHLARSRCGNRISEAPAEPVSTAEPEVEALEKPAEPALLAVAEAPIALPIAPPSTTEIEPPDNGTIFIPPGFPIWFGGGTPSTPGVPIGPPAPPPPAPTPEPGTLVLIATGLAALSLRRMRRAS